MGSPAFNKSAGLVPSLYFKSVSLKSFIFDRFASKVPFLQFVSKHEVDFIIHKTKMIVEELVILLERFEIVAGC